MEFQKRFANVLIIYSFRFLSQREAKRDRWFFMIFFSSFHVIWSSIWLKVVSKNADRIWFKCKFCWLFSLNWNKMLPHCADGAHTHTLCWCFMLNVYIVTHTYPRYAKLLAWLLPALFNSNQFHIFCRYFFHLNDFSAKKNWINSAKYSCSEMPMNKQKSGNVKVWQ